MADRLADRSRLHASANAALDVNLAGDEAVEVLVVGAGKQAIIGTGRRAFVCKEGFMAGATFGSELGSWDYSNLVGVLLDTGMLSGVVVLQVPGQPGAATALGKRGGYAYKAPNAIPIDRPWKDAAAGVVRLRQLIDAAHQRAVPPDTRATSDESLRDASTEVLLLHHLGALRDAGVLTSAEFEIKKAQVLDRI